MITVIAGTNRPNSNSLKLATLLESMHVAAGHEVTLLDLATLPPDVFSPEVYKQKSAAFIEGFIEPVLAADGLHVVVPEYNGSFPGILKYFVDLLPFPHAFEGRPAAFVGLSSGIFGALRAVEQLQLVFGYRNAQIYPRRVFLPAVHQHFDGEGIFSDDELRGRLEAQVAGFQEFVRRVRD